MKKWLLRIVGGFIALIVIAVLALGFWPVAPDVPTVGARGKAGDPTPPSSTDVRGTGQTITVNAGESIQAAVDRAKPGDTIRVMPGTYHEEVMVQTDSLTLAGVVEGDQRPVLDGQGTRANGVTAVADYFTITGFKVVNYTSNGVTVQTVTGPVFRDIVTDKTGEYGLFPILSSDILIEKCVSSGVIDTGIYVGQSRGIVVRDSEAFGNVSGFEIENSVDALVENNSSHDNTIGIVVFLLPNKTSTEGSDTRVVNNRFENNNLANFATPEMIVSNLPAGTGVLIVAADRTEITGNTFTNNKSYAVGMVALTDFAYLFQNRTEWDVPVLPEGNWIHGNTYNHNGYDPDPVVIKAGFKGADLLWSAQGDGNRWDDASATQFPSPLPSSAWPAFIRRAYWRILNFLATKL
jgi:cytochrome c peroxidase